MRQGLIEATQPQKSGAAHSIAFTPAVRFALAGAIGGAALIAISRVVLGLSADDGSVVVAVGVYSAAVLVFAYAMHRSYPHDRVGMCNLVTLTRLVIVGALLVATLDAIPAGWGLLSLAALALCLDGVDGWLARKQGVASEFGARFDVEVDAAFALLLTVYAVRTDIAGLYVLALGLPHYLFCIARTVAPWLNAALPPRFSRKAICVLQIATLLLLLVPQVGGAALAVAISATALALVWSFAVDIRWLYRNRT
ncbi:MAG: CDP-alcohol phosphatidyltransferase family protein [Pseudomonadota bacterium]